MNRLPFSVVILGSLALIAAILLPAEVAGITNCCGLGRF